MRASRERPNRPIIALSPIVETARRLALVWGLHCVVTQDARSLEDMVDRAAAIAFQEGFCKGGDRFLVTAGVPPWNARCDKSLAYCFCLSRWNERDLSRLRMVFFHAPLNRL